MTSRHCMRGIALVALFASSFALAQERGRTDGPEGSEYGKGGYSRTSGGKFSLALDFGAAIGENPYLSGANRIPLMVGGTATFWADEWFVLDLDGIYNFQQSRLHVLVGPRFRTPFWPVSLWAGLKAGPTITQGEGVRFSLTPTVGADMIVGNHILAGLGYAYDLQFGASAYSDHRIYMTIGYRF